MSIGECEHVFFFPGVLWGPHKGSWIHSRRFRCHLYWMWPCGSVYLDIRGALDGTLLGNPQELQEATLMDTYSNWISTRSNQWMLSFHSHASMAGRFWRQSWSHDSDYRRTFPEGAVVPPSSAGDNPLVQQPKYLCVGTRQSWHRKCANWQRPRRWLRRMLSYEN